MSYSTPKDHPTLVMENATHTMIKEVLQGPALTPYAWRDQVPIHLIGCLFRYAPPPSQPHVLRMVIIF